MKHEIKLPPLPNWTLTWDDEFIEELKAYATAAIEADRQANGEPVAWPNGCDKTVPQALRYLADHERPNGGSHEFNSAHLFQLADEIERMARQPLYTAPQPQQIPEGVRQAIQKAYGVLWMVNNEPGTPNQYQSEKAAYKARRLLREILNVEERGDGINSAMLEAAPEPKEQP